MSFPAPVVNLRTSLGRPLTWAEEDASLSNIQQFCAAVGLLFNNDGSIDPTLLQNTINQYLATAFISQNQSFLAPIGKPVWMPKAMDPSVVLPDNGTAYLRADGSKFLQTDYPKLFAYLGHSYDADSTLTGVAVHAGTNTHVATVAVHAGGGGSGYLVNDLISVNGGVGTGASLKVTGVSGTAVTTLSVVACGDYTASPASSAAATTAFTGSGSGCTVDLTFFTGGGGSGYVVNDVLVLSGGIGSAAKVKVTGTNLTSVTSVSVLTLGAYTIGPSTPNAAAFGSGTGVSLDLTFSNTVNAATEFRVPVLDGCFLFGADGEILVGSASGEKAHMLTAAESGLPDHTHSAQNQVAGSDLTGAANPLKTVAGNTGGVTGGGKNASVAHNTMPPYRAGLMYLVAGYRVNKAWV